MPEPARAMACAAGQVRSWLLYTLLALASLEGCKAGSKVEPTPLVWRMESSASLASLVIRSMYCQLEPFRPCDLPERLKLEPIKEWASKDLGWERMLASLSLYELARRFWQQQDYERSLFSVEQSIALKLYPYEDLVLQSRWQHNLVAPGYLFKRPKLELADALILKANCMFELGKRDTSLDYLYQSLEAIHLSAAMMHTSMDLVPEVFTHLEGLAKAVGGAAGEVLNKMTLIQLQETMVRYGIGCQGCQGRADALSELVYRMALPLRYMPESGHLEVLDQPFIHSAYAKQKYETKKQYMQRFFAQLVGMVHSRFLSELRTPCTYHDASGGCISYLPAWVYANAGASSSRKGVPSSQSATESHVPSGVPSSSQQQSASSTPPVPPLWGLSSHYSRSPDTEQCHAAGLDSVSHSSCQPDPGSPDSPADPSQPPTPPLQPAPSPSSQSPPVSQSVSKPSATKGRKGKRNSTSAGADSSTNSSSSAAASPTKEPTSSQPSPAPLNMMHPHHRADLEPVPFPEDGDSEGVTTMLDKQRLRPYSLSDINALVDGFIVAGIVRDSTQLLSTLNYLSAFTSVITTPEVYHAQFAKAAASAAAAAMAAGTTKQSTTPQHQSAQSSSQQPLPPQEASHQAHGMPITAEIIPAAPDTPPGYTRYRVTLTPSELWPQPEKDCTTSSTSPTCRKLAAGQQAQQPSEPSQPQSQSDAPVSLYQVPLSPLTTKPPPPDPNKDYCCPSYRRLYLPQLTPEQSDLVHAMAAALKSQLDHPGNAARSQGPSIHPAQSSGGSSSGIAPGSSAGTAGYPSSTGGLSPELIAAAAAAAGVSPGGLPPEAGVMINSNPPEASGLDASYRHISDRQLQEYLSRLTQQQPQRQDEPLVILTLSGVTLCLILSVGVFKNRKRVTRYISDRASTSRHSPLLHHHPVRSLATLLFPSSTSTLPRSTSDTSASPNTYQLNPQCSSGELHTSHDTYKRSWLESLASQWGAAHQRRAATAALRDAMTGCDLSKLESAVHAGEQAGLEAELLSKGRQLISQLRKREKEKGATASASGNKAKSKGGPSSRASAGGANPAHNTQTAGASSPGGAQQQSVLAGNNSQLHVSQHPQVLEHASGGVSPIKQAQHNVPAAPSSERKSLSEDGNALRWSASGGWLSSLWSSLRSLSGRATGAAEDNSAEPETQETLCQNSCPLDKQSCDTAASAQEEGGSHKSSNNSSRKATSTSNKSCTPSAPQLADTSPCLKQGESSGSLAAGGSSEGANFPTSAWVSDTAPPTYMPYEDQASAEGPEEGWQQHVGRSARRRGAAASGGGAVAAYNKDAHLATGRMAEGAAAYPPPAPPPPAPRTKHSYHSNKDNVGVSQAGDVGDAASRVTVPLHRRRSSSSGWFEWLTDSMRSSATALNALAGSSSLGSAAVMAGVSGHPESVSSLVTQSSQASSSSQLLAYNRGNLSAAAISGVSDGSKVGQTEVLPSSHVSAQQQKGKNRAAGNVSDGMPGAPAAGSVTATILAQQPGAVKDNRNTSAGGAAKHNVTAAASNPAMPYATPLPPGDASLLSQAAPIRTSKVSAGGAPTTPSHIPTTTHAVNGGAVNQASATAAAAAAAAVAAVSGRHPRSTAALYSSPGGGQPASASSNPTAHITSPVPRGSTGGIGPAGALNTRTRISTGGNPTEEPVSPTTAEAAAAATAAVSSAGLMGNLSLLTIHKPAPPSTPASAAPTGPPSPTTAEAAAAATAAVSGVGLMGALASLVSPTGKVGGTAGKSGGTAAGAVSQSAASTAPPSPTAACAAAAAAAAAVGPPLGRQSQGSVFTAWKGASAAPPPPPPPPRRSQGGNPAAVAQRASGVPGTDGYAEDDSLLDPFANLPESLWGPILEQATTEGWPMPPPPPPPPPPGYLRHQPQSHGLSATTPPSAALELSHSVASTPAAVSLSIHAPVWQPGCGAHLSPTHSSPSLRMNPSSLLNPAAPAFKAGTSSSGGGAMSARPARAGAPTQQHHQSTQHSLSASQLPLGGALSPRLFASTASGDAAAALVSNAVGAGGNTALLGGGSHGGGLGLATLGSTSVNAGGIMSTSSSVTSNLTGLHLSPLGLGIGATAAGAPARGGLLDPRQTASATAAAAAAHQRLLRPDTLGTGLPPSASAVAAIANTFPGLAAAAAAAQQQQVEQGLLAPDSGLSMLSLGGATGTARQGFTASAGGTGAAPTPSTASAAAAAAGLPSTAPSAVTNFNMFAGSSVWSPSAVTADSHDGWGAPLAGIQSSSALLGAANNTSILGVGISAAPGLSLTASGSYGVGPGTGTSTGTATVNDYHSASGRPSYNGGPSPAAGMTSAFSRQPLYPTEGGAPVAMQSSTLLGGAPFPSGLCLGAATVTADGAGGLLGGLQLHHQQFLDTAAADADHELEEGLPPLPTSLDVALGTEGSDTAGLAWAVHDLIQGVVDL